MKNCANGACKHLAWITVGVAAVTVTLLALAGRWFWLPEILCPFRPQLAGVLALGAVAWGWAGRRAAAAGLGALALISAWPTLALYFPASTPELRGPPLRVASINLLWGTNNFDAVAQWLAAEAPDVVFFTEVDITRRDRLAELLERYPHQHVSPAPSQWSEKTWGRAILSRRPFLSEREHWPEHVVDVSIEHSGHTLRVLGAHPVRPGRADLTRGRNRTLARLAELAGEQADVVVIGDLNVTEGSPHWSQLLQSAHLSDTRAGRGPMGSWKAHVPHLEWPLPLRLPIDHVLVGASLGCIDRRLGPEIGSDHFPVVADVGWR